MYTVYILRSKKTGRHYYGHSKNLDNRLKDHNNGRVRSTKAHKPWVIIHTERFATKAEARQREFFYKSIEGYRYLKKHGII